MSKKVVKENPIIKSKNAKGIKGNSSEENSEIKKFIIIIIVLALLVGAVYGLTLLFSNDKEEYTFVPTKGEINYDKVIVGTILNRPEKEYFVMVYDSTNEDAAKYDGLISQHMSKSSEKNYINIYYCDLNNKLNKDYYNVNNDNKSNKKAKEVSEFDFGDLTLLHIKKGKITVYLEDYKTIQEKLK